MVLDSTKIRLVIKWILSGTGIKLNFVDDRLISLNIWLVSISQVVLIRILISVEN
jgi:hypothetical protein